MYWLRTLSLLVVSSRVKTKALFVSRYSTEVSVRELQNSLMEKLRLSSIVCTNLKKENKYK